MVLEPIFLQSLWRSCSTYFWEKFRGNADWRCFNEPLHEILAVLDERGIDENESVRVLRHPRLNEHYFAEYPLQPGGGVPHFQKRFTVENYYLRPGSEDEGLKKYLDGLFACAAENMQRPFLQPNRAVLRGEWMKEQCGGVHMYLNRNFDELIRSYFSFGDNNSYFLHCYAAIIGQNAHDPFFRDIAALKGLVPYKGESFVKESRHFAAAVAAWDRQDFRDIVAFIWVCGLAQASRYADILIEVSRLPDPEYRRTLQGAVLDQLNSYLDLTDFDPPEAGDENDLVVSEPARELIKKALNELQPDWSRLEKMGAAVSTRRFLRFL